MRALSDDSDLSAKTEEFKERLSSRRYVDQIITGSLCCGTRSCLDEHLKMRHFDVQLIGGMVLHQGKIAEMRTGEGKTLVATLPLYLNALTGKGVHLVTVNDYLAKRDAEWNKPIYEFFGMRWV